MRRDDMAATVPAAADEPRRTVRQRSSLVPESLTEALIAAVRALGGSKAVGPLLWPEQAPDAAQRKLLDALNDDRPQRLSPEQVLLVMRQARAAGCHVVMQYLADTLSYAEPVPVEPRDEADELRRQVLAMGQSLQRALARIEQLEAPRGGLGRG